MDKYTGLLINLKKIDSAPFLVQFEILTEEKEKILCVCGKYMLSKSILQLTDSTYNVKIKGHYNARDQFVVTWLAVNNGDKFTKGLGL